MTSDSNLSASMAQLALGQLRLDRLPVELIELVTEEVAQSGDKLIDHFADNPTEGAIIHCTNRDLLPLRLTSKLFNNVAVKEYTAKPGVVHCYRHEMPKGKFFMDKWWLVALVNLSRRADAAYITHLCFIKRTEPIDEERKARYEILAPRYQHNLRNVSRHFAAFPRLVAIEVRPETRSTPYATLSEAYNWQLFLGHLTSELPQRVQKLEVEKVHILRSLRADSPSSPVSGHHLISLRYDTMDTLENGPFDATADYAIASTVVQLTYLHPLVVEVPLDYRVSDKLLHNLSNMKLVHLSGYHVGYEGLRAFLEKNASTLESFHLKGSWCGAGNMPQLAFEGIELPRLRWLGLRYSIIIAETTVKSCEQKEELRWTWRMGGPLSLQIFKEWVSSEMS